MIDVIVALLSRPDPADLQTPAGIRRGHVLKFEGEPDRRETRYAALLTAWAQHRHLAVDPDPMLAPAVRRGRRWTLLANRRTA